MTSLTRNPVPTWCEDLAASGPIWRSIWQQVANDSRSRARGSVLAVIPLIAAIAFASVPATTSASLGSVIWICVATLLVVGLAALQMAGLSNLMMQNKAQAAKLVPGHVRRLRRCLLVSTLSTQLALLAVMTFVVPDGLWSSFAMISGLAIVMIAVKRWPQWMPLGGLAPLAIVKLEEQGQSLMAPLFERPEIGVLGLAVLSGVLAWRAIQDGGLAHQRHQMRQQAWLDSFTKPAAGPAWRVRLVNPLGPRATRRRLAYLSTRQANPVARALFGLEPKLDLLVTGATWAGALPVVALFTMAWWWLMGLGRKTHDFPWTVILIWGPMVCLGVVATARMSFKRSAGEQALLRLCPGMPSGIALNRQIGRALLSRFLWLWALGSLASAALLQAIGNPDPMVELGVLMFALGTSTVAWRTLTDWSRVVPGVRLADVVLDFLGSLAIAVALWATHALLHVPVAPLVLGAAMAWLGLMAWRWQRLSALPCAWPTGRMAHRSAGRPAESQTAVTQGL